MTDRIDTDAIRGRWGTLREPTNVPLHDVLVLCDEVDRLRALADPAPVGLTEDERRIVDEARRRWNGVPGRPYALIAIIDRLSAAPVDDRERLAELEDWLLGAEHHAGCSGEYKNDDGAWSYRCKCGLRELRDERPVSPSVDPEEKP